MSGETETEAQYNRCISVVLEAGRRWLRANPLAVIVIQRARAEFVAACGVDDEDLDGAILEGVTRELEKKPEYIQNYGKWGSPIDEQLAELAQSATRRAEKRRGVPGKAGVCNHCDCGSDTDPCEHCGRGVGDQVRGRR